MATEEMLTDFNETEKYKRKGELVQCDQCDYVGSRTSLYGHKNNKHAGIRFPCDQCSYSATLSSNLKRHKEIKHSVIRYQCDQCEYSGVTPALLKYHRESFHEGIRYNCELCQYSSKTRTLLKKHTESFHCGIRYPCDECPYASTDLSNLKRHKKALHEAKKSFSCAQCDYTTTSEHLLKKHKESKHDGVSYPCDQCPYTGSSKALLKSHKQSKHAGVFYPCGQCSYTSSSMSNLKRHYKAKHVGKNTHGSKEGNVQKTLLSREKEFQEIRVKEEALEESDIYTGAYTEEDSYLEDPLVVDFPLEVMVQEGFEGEVDIDHNNHVDEDGDKINAYQGNHGSECLDNSEEDSSKQDNQSVRIKLEINDDNSSDVKNDDAININDKMNTYQGKHENEYQNVSIKVENNDDNDDEFNINDQINCYQGNHENEHLDNSKKDGSNAIGIKLEYYDNIFDGKNDDAVNINDKMDQENERENNDDNDEEFNINDKMPTCPGNHEKRYLDDSEDDCNKQENPSFRINGDSDDDSVDVRNNRESKTDEEMNSYKGVHDTENDNVRSSENDENKQEISSLRIKGDNNDDSFDDSSIDDA